MSWLDRYRQAQARVAMQIAIVGAQAARRRLERVQMRLRAEGVLPTPDELPSLLREQAD